MIFLTSSAIKKVFLLFVVLGLIALTQKDRLPPKQELVNSVFKEPLQTEIQKEPFTIYIKSEEYHLYPVYAYELNGLIVSNHHSSSWMDISHEKSSDYLNIVDLCVMYGDNLSSEVYRHMTFQSGDWTCYPQWSRENYIKYDLGKTYKNHYLSNNHVLADNPQLIKKIQSAHKGDQIYIKGYLVNYANKKWTPFLRNTSTVRDDHGCEIIYVTDFQILNRANSFWHFIYHFSKWMLIICAASFFIVGHFEASRFIDEKQA